MKRALLFLFLLPISFAYAQSKVDSLQNVLENTIIDSIKIETLHHLYREYKNGEIDRAKKTILRAVTLSEQTKNHHIKVKSYNLYANFLRSQSKDDSALVVNKKSLALARQLGFKKGESRVLLGIGKSYWRKANFIKAREYHELNLKLVLELKDESLIASAYSGIGNIHAQNGEYTKAMEYYTLASQKYYNVDNLLSYAKSLDNIGFIQRSLESYESAENYFIQTDSIYKKLKNLNGQAFSTYNLGIVLPFRTTGGYVLTGYSYSTDGGCHWQSWQ